MHIDRSVFTKNFGDQVSQLPNFDHNFVSPNFATHTHQSTPNFDHANFDHHRS
jgi:hypothetical protein